MGLFSSEPPTADEFDEFLDRHLQRLNRLALALTHNPTDAEDLMQDTLAKVIVNWRKVQTSDTQPAYVRTILVNTFMSSRRKRSATEVISDEAVALRLAPINEDFGDRDFVRDLVRALPPTQRVVVTLRYLEDLPVAQVAGVLGMPEATVRSHCHRALASMRAEVSMS